MAALVALATVALLLAAAGASASPSGQLSAAAAQAAPDWGAPQQLAGYSQSPALVSASADGVITGVSAVDALTGADGTANVEGQTSTGGAFDTPVKIGNTGDDGGPPQAGVTSEDEWLFGHQGIDRLATGPAGDAALTWERCDYPSDGSGANTCYLQAAYRAPHATAWTDLGPLLTDPWSTAGNPTPIRMAADAVDAAGNATFVWMTDTNNNGGFVIDEADATPSGGLGATRTLYSDPTGGQYAGDYLNFFLREDGAGDATIVFETPDATTNQPDWWSISRATGTWRSAQPVLMNDSSSTPTAMLVDVAVDHFGAAHALFSAPADYSSTGAFTSLFTLEQSTAGSSWGNQQAIPGGTDVNGAGTQPGVARLLTDDSGNLTAAWVNLSPTSDGHTNYAIDLSRRPQGGTWDATPTPVAQYADTANTNNQVVLDAAGNARGDVVVGWVNDLVDYSTGTMMQALNVYGSLIPAGQAPGPVETLDSITGDNTSNGAPTVSMDQHGIASIAYVPYNPTEANNGGATAGNKPVHVVTSTTPLDAATPLTLNKSADNTPDVTLSGGGAEPNTNVTITLTRGSDGKTFPLTVPADQNGNFTTTVDNGATFLAGTYTAQGVQGQHQSGSISFTLAASKLTLAASNTDHAHFILSGSGADPGQDVALTITPQGGHPTSTSATADSAGNYVAQIAAGDGTGFSAGTYSAVAHEGQHDSPTITFTLDPPAPPAPAHPPSSGKGGGYTVQGLGTTPPTMNVSTDGIGQGYNSWAPSSAGQDPGFYDDLPGGDISVVFGCGPGDGGPVTSCTMSIGGHSWSAPTGSGLPGEFALTEGRDFPTYSPSCGMVCHLTLTGTATDAAGNTRTESYNFTVHPATTANLANLNLSLTGQLNSVVANASGINSGSEPVSYYTVSENVNGSPQTVCLIGSDGSIIVGNVIAAGSGNVIAAGSGNVINAGSGNVINAGAYNVINAGAYNLVPLRDDTGWAIMDGDSALGKVIAAGAHNFQILGHSGNVIAAGAWNVIAAGSGNVINAGAYNVINAGAHNVINAGAYNVIAAGAGNIGSQVDVQALEQAVSGAPGETLGETLQIGSAAARGAAVAAAAPIRLAAGAIHFTAVHRKGVMLLVLSRRGSQLIAHLQTINAQLRRRHRRLKRLKIMVIAQAISGSHRTTRTRTITVTPLPPRHPKGPKTH